MKSEVFGTLSPVDHFEGETAMDGTFPALTDNNCHVTIRGGLSASQLMARAESLFQRFQNSIPEVKQSIKDWIPERYRESGFEFNGDAGSVVDALRIDSFTFSIWEEGSESWLYASAEAGLTEDDRNGPLGGQDIVVYFDDSMKVTRLETDG